MITKIINGKTVNFMNNVNEIKLEVMAKYNNIITDKNLDEIDIIIKMLTLLSDSTEEVIENMELNDATSLFNDILINNKIEIELTNEDFVVNNRIFRVKEKTSIKDISLVKKVIDQKKDDFTYIYDIAAIIYKEVLPDGNLKMDYSIECIQEKSELFAKEMTYNYIIFHLNNLTAILTKDATNVG